MMPVCLKCKVQMVYKRVGVDVELMTGAEPYQIWHADHFECPSCGIGIIAQFGQKPIAEHFQRERYAAFLPTVLTRFWATLTDKAAA